MPDVQNTVELKSGGQIFGGWKSVRVSRGIEQLAGRFDLDVTDRWPDQGTQKPLKPGASCEVLLNGETIITGYVDDVRINYDDRNHQLACGGRDKTGDLVDCAAVHKSGQWVNKSLAQIARDLVAPFKLKVIVDAGVDVGKPFPTWNIQPSETVFECLERAARMRAVLLTSNPQGDLVITRAGAGSAAVKTPLVEGINIKSATAEWSWLERFSAYTVLSQGRMEDTDTDDTAVHAKAVVKDPIINRYRPYTVLSEDQGSSATLKERAQWEQSVRAGRGNRGTIAVQGWHHADGLWLPNSLVHVRSPMLALDAEMLIVRCEYSIDDSGGTVTALTIARREAFELVEGAAASRLNRKLDGKRWRKKKDEGEVDLEWGLQ